MQKITIYLAGLLLLTGCFGGSPATDISLPPIFSDNMVLQRDANLNLWGKATPHERVTVIFKNQRASIVVEEDSSWQLMLAPEPAGGPFELQIFGQDTLTFSNVMLGDVWIASGQSNMEWPLSATSNSKAAIDAAVDEDLRLFTVEKTVAATPQYAIPSDGWKITSPAEVTSFSAVAYYFGSMLRRSLDIPVGLIHSSWGGTPAESWTSAKSLVDHPDYAAFVSRMVEDPNAFIPDLTTAEWLALIEETDEGLDGENPLWAAPALDDVAWPTMALPVLWESAGLTNYDGVVWFRTQVNIPASWMGKDLSLRVGKIDDADITWVNGSEVGATNQYNADRQYNVPASVVKSGVNVIAIRVLDTGGGGGVWGEATNLNIQPADGSTAPISLAGNWKYQRGVDFDDADLPPNPNGRQHTPTVLYNSMIHPIVQYSAKGAIWYQGESNAGRAHQYRTLFPMMIEDWRSQWQLSLDFYFVQLANFMDQQVNPVEAETWPELREAQTLALELANTGMAVTIDIGEADDIHPRNKKDVGERLARAALHQTYGQDITPAGPLYKSHAVEGNAMRITFDYADQLMPSSGNEITGFAIAGADSVFHWASATADSNTVLVASRAVQSPLAVRYGWANNPIVNLQNGDGLPASPFRTDAWPGITEGVR